MLGHQSAAELVGHRPEPVGSRGAPRAPRAQPSVTRCRSSARTQSAGGDIWIQKSCRKQGQDQLGRCAGSALCVSLCPHHARRNHTQKHSERPRQELGVSAGPESQECREREDKTERRRPRNRKQPPGTAETGLDHNLEPRPAKDDRYGNKSAGAAGEAQGRPSWLAIRSMPPPPPDPPRNKHTHPPPPPKQAHHPPPPPQWHLFTLSRAKRGKKNRRGGKKGAKRGREITRLTSRRRQEAAEPSAHLRATFTN